MSYLTIGLPRSWGRALTKSLVWVGQLLLRDIPLSSAVIANLEIYHIAIVLILETWLKKVGHKWKEASFSS